MEYILNYRNMTKINIQFKLCPKCNFFCGSEEADKFCSICGSELITKCPNCNNPISNSYAKYCKHCGKAYPGKVVKKNKFTELNSNEKS